MSIITLEPRVSANIPSITEEQGNINLHFLKTLSARLDQQFDIDSNVANLGVNYQLEWWNNDDSLCAITWWRNKNKITLYKCQDGNELINDSFSFPYEIYDKYPNLEFAS